MLLATIDSYAINYFRLNRHVLHRYSVVLDGRVTPIAGMAWRHVVTATSSTLPENSTSFAVNHQTHLSRYSDNMLNKLPNEILHLVFQNLARSPKLIHGEDAEHLNYHLDSWATLAQLCKVSRSMRHVAEPLLYRNYQKPNSTWDTDNHYTFREFLHTVLGRPELLRHVRSLYIGSWRVKDHDQPEEEGYETPDTPTIREALTNSRYTLKELTLNTPWMSLLEATRRFFTNGKASIGTLTDFTTLRKLDVLQNTLIGFGVINSTPAVPKLPLEELLPSSLESLTIDQCTRAIIPYLEEMSIGLEDKFPHLQEIQLSQVEAKESDVTHLPEDQREIVKRRWNHRIERLKERFISAGVQWLPTLERKDRY
jgi:hypothetical protein